MEVGEGSHGRVLGLCLLELGSLNVDTPVCGIEVWTENMTGIAGDIEGL